MHRSYHQWFSPTLGRPMELLVFGHQGAPVLVFNRVSYSSDEPIEFATSWYRADRYEVQMALTG